MNAAAAFVAALVGALLGLFVGALLAAARIAELSERVDWMQWLLDREADAEHDQIVAEFRAELDDWDEG